MSGKLILVVGPSGVGKDTLIETAKEYLAEDDRFIFPRRYITRPEGAGGENHKALTVQEFLEKQEKNRFALSWQAHGLHYGIPVSTIRDVSNGNTVIINTSRTILEEAKAKYDAVRVAYVNAKAETLRDRLKARGRESEHEIEQRINRATAYDLKGPEIFAIDNSGPLEVAVQPFVKLISDPLRASA